MAENDSSLSFRGSCLLALSFIAANPELHPVFEKHGWFCTITNGNVICLPRDYSKFFSNIISLENWTLPFCSHFSTEGSAAPNPHESAHESSQRPLRRSSTMGIYSSISTTSNVILDNSFASSLGSRPTRHNSTSSFDSRGTGKFSLTFDDPIQHYNKSHECPSDITLNGKIHDKGIIDMIQKISGDGGMM